MSFKRAFSALSTLVLAAFSLNMQCFAETPDSAEEERSSFSSDLSLVERSYDDESMMYRYTFPDDAQFYSSERLTDAENPVSVLLVGSEDDDVSILVNSGSGFLEQADEYFLTEDGAYEVTVSHALRNGSGSVQARFSAVIGEQSAAPEKQVFSGRFELENIDGENFRHSFINGSEFITNVLDGETVNFTPKLSVPDSVICTVTRDGNLYSMPSSGFITEDGAYTMEFSCFDNDGNMEKRFFSFNVFTKPTNRLGIYQPPYGYELTSVTLNGENIPLTDKDHVVLNGEGDYFIEYTDGSVTRGVLLSRDTVPPVLYFNGTSDIVFTEQVVVSSDTDCTLRVTKNGQIVGNVSELHGSGLYRITATDEAGNITFVRLEIKSVSAINPLDIIIIFAALIIAAVGYYIIQKNRRITVR